MCRKKHMQGLCIIAFGLGLITGHCLESWFLCCCGGISLIIFGCMVMQQK